MTSPEETIGDLFGDLGLLHVTAEVWAVAADEAGIWLVSPGGPWATLPIVRGDSPHRAIVRELQTRGLYVRGMPLHQTSCRTDGPAQVQTYLAAIRCEGPVPARFPEARPVSLALAELAGPPPTQPADEVPVFALLHVLEHGLRHFAYLRQTDATFRRALDQHSPYMWEHLGAWEPTLACLYSQAHQEPADVEAAVRAAWHSAEGTAR